jgi:hypothetical protein
MSTIIISRSSCPTGEWIRLTSAPGSAGVPPASKGDDNTAGIKVVKKCSNVCPNRYLGPNKGGRGDAHSRTKQMADRPQEILICSCGDTMPIDVESVRHGCPGSRVTTARELCRAELSKFHTTVSAGVPLIVGCTREPVFGKDHAPTASTKSPAAATPTQKSHRSAAYKGQQTIYT